MWQGTAGISRDVDGGSLKCQRLPSDSRSLRLLSVRTCFTVGLSAEPSRLLIVKLTASFPEIGIFYQFPQFFQCKKNARFDCRYRPPRNLRDLFIAELFVNPQLEDRLLFRWQLFDHAAEVFALFAVFHLGLDRRPNAADGFRHFNELLRVFLDVIDAV